MSEPSGVVAGGLLASIAGAGWFAGIDGNAATGALCGSLIFFMARHEIEIWKRLVYFIISLVMGYLFSPGLTEFEVWGFKVEMFMLSKSVSMYSLQATGQEMLKN